MVLLVMGGSGSGKSAYAEMRTAELGKGAGGRLLYLATMEPYDEESHRRIARHRRMRKDKNFITLECQTHLEEVAVQEGDTLLLECISNLTANEMYGSKGRGKEAARVILEGIRRLAREAAHMVLVGNQVFSDGISYDPSTAEYLGQMALIQREAAAMADEAVEVVCGIPVWLKGGSKGRNKMVTKGAVTLE